MLFIGTDSGLIVIDKDKVVEDIPIKEIDTSYSFIKDFKSLQTFFAGIRIRSIFQDSDGHLWFSTYSDRGLVEYYDGKLKVYKTTEGLPSDKVRIVCERKDKVKMVSCSGGMALIQASAILRY